MLPPTLRTLKRIPIAGPVLSLIWRWLRTRALVGRSTEEVFTNIYRRNGWGGRESASGTGSDLAETDQVIAALENIIRDYEVRSILDIPCGDFNWMRNVNLNGVSYFGADIVQELINHNQRYAIVDRIVFQNMNILVDRLPKVDLILSRDCLVHFSFEDVFKALRNIAASGSDLFLTTTFPARPRNVQILTGEWQPLNLQQGPFWLPPPIKVIGEGRDEARGGYADKSLGLWNVGELKAHLK